MDPVCVPNTCVMQPPESKPVGGAMTRHGGYTLVMWWGSPSLLAGFVLGRAFLPSHYYFSLCSYPPPATWMQNSSSLADWMECKWLWSQRGATVLFWAESSPGVLRTWVIIAGGSLALADAHLKSNAVRVLEHFRIILPTIWGVLQTGAIKHQRRSVSKWRCIRSEVRKPHLFLWITSVCCCHWQFWEPLELKDVSFCITTNETSERKDKLLLGEI